MADAREFAELMRGRADSYALLSRLFRTEVSKEIYDQLAAATLPTQTGSIDIDEGYTLMEAWLRNPTGEDPITELAVDYTRTFISRGIGGHAAAYPYESVYTSEKRLLMQKARTEVVQAYRSAGFTKADWKEPEDHIAVELEFMELLALRCAEAFDTGEEENAREALEMQRSFMEDHLAVWVSEFTVDMEKFAKTGFYLGLARVLRGFIAEDRVFLDEVVS